MTKEQEFRKQTEEAKFEAFSLMCKKVAELERDLDYQKQARTIAENAVIDLQKENTELKTKYLQSTDEGTSFAHLKSLEGKLAQAKELLNGCIIKARGNVNPSWLELITDIQQFLKEIEKC